MDFSALMSGEGCRYRPRQGLDARLFGLLQNANCLCSPIAKISRILYLNAIVSERICVRIAQAIETNYRSCLTIQQDYAMKRLKGSRVVILFSLAVLYIFMHSLGSPMLESSKEGLSVRYPYSNEPLKMILLLCALIGIIYCIISSRLQHFNNAVIDF